MFNTRRGRAINLQQYAVAVESILGRIGVNAQQARMNTLQEGYGWHFTRGSALIEIYVSQHENAGYLQVLAPLMHLPPSGVLPLYRQLLENNLNLTAAAFGVHDDVVYIYHERPLDGLDADEADAIVNFIASAADEFDDKLVNEFGGRLYRRV